MSWDEGMLEVSANPRVKRISGPPPDFDEPYDDDTPIRSDGWPDSDIVGIPPSQEMKNLDDLYDLDAAVARQERREARGDLSDHESPAQGRTGAYSASFKDFIAAKLEQNPAKKPDSAKDGLEAAAQIPIVPMIVAIVASIIVFVASSYASLSDIDVSLRWVLGILGGASIAMVYNSRGVRDAAIYAAALIVLVVSSHWSALVIPILVAAAACFVIGRGLL